MKEAWQIQISGIVQGVGFRPRVYALAQSLQVKGEVSNGPEGVEISIDGSKDQALHFLQEIQAKAPKLARITHSSIREITQGGFRDFSIASSHNGSPARVQITPDYAICEQCKREVDAPDNRRFGYPFTTCTECGPRYSIIQGLPYDRETTTMQVYTQCPDCAAEYQDPQSRRHHSQTNSCGVCGITYELLESGDSPNTQASNLTEICPRVHELWKAGKVVALKGIGGYLLTCDATVARAVARLREIKQRPSKPFAVMYRSLEALSRYQLAPEERQSLSSEVAPIVLLRPGPEGHGLADAALASLENVGVMLPYTPLYHLLLKDYPNPIVASSANVHNSPILFEDGDLPTLLRLADAVLSNNRAIVVPQDDSLIRFSPRQQQKIILRRSRGLAPNYFNPKLPLPEGSILAVGADKKAAFSLLSRQNVFISQYLGSLFHFDAQQNFRKVVDHLGNMLHAQAEVVLCDRHPQYESRRIAEELAQQYDCPLHSYQHHAAHFAAILGEKTLIHQAEPILGVIWDGTGYGDDGQIWGGEFFRYASGKISRAGHIGYFPVIAGDKMAQEPRLAAFSILGSDPLERLSPSENQVYSQLRERSQLGSSSMGRLFDAVASLLGLCQKQSFEGEAAMQVEALARQGQAQISERPLPYTWQTDKACWEPRAVLEQIVSDLADGLSTAQIAYRFHLSLVELVRLQADALQLRHIAFSGGVFQNALLVDLLIEQLGPLYNLHFHEELSPNDENISFGQLILYLIETGKI